MHQTNTFQSMSPNIPGYTWQGHKDLDTGGRGGTHASRTKDKVRKTFRKRMRRWKQDEE